MLIPRAASALVLFCSLCWGANIDVSRTFNLLHEGEQLSPDRVAELESKVTKKPGDLDDRLRLLAYYAGQTGSNDAEAIRSARAHHILWLIQNGPKASVFSLATRVYAIQLTGGPLADPANFEAAKQAWLSQISSHPDDNGIKTSAVTFLEIQDPGAAEPLLKAIGNSRGLGQLYAQAILGIVASDYRTSDPILTSDDRRNSQFAQHALAELEASNDAALLGGAGFTLCHDGGLLYADGKLDWDYVPLASKLLTKAEQIDPSNQDAFSVVPQLPKRGERPAPVIRIGGTQLITSLRKRVDPLRPPEAPPTKEPVRLNVFIGLDGRVLRAVAITGPSQLRDAATAAVKQWTFAPMSMHGKPVYVLSSLDIVF